MHNNFTIRLSNQRGDEYLSLKNRQSLVQSIFDMRFQFDSSNCGCFPLYLLNLYKCRVHRECLAKLH